MYCSSCPFWANQEDNKSVILQVLPIPRINSTSSTKPMLSISSASSRTRNFNDFKSRLLLSIRSYIGLENKINKDSGEFNIYEANNAKKVLRKEIEIYFYPTRCSNYHINPSLQGIFLVAHRSPSIYTASR